MPLSIYHIRMKASDLWETHLQYFAPMGNFSTHLYQIIPSLWDIPNFGRKGEHAIVLVTT